MHAVDTDDSDDDDNAYGIWLSWIGRFDAVTTHFRDKIVRSMRFLLFVEKDVDYSFIYFLFM